MPLIMRNGIVKSAKNTITDIKAERQEELNVLRARVEQLEQALREWQRLDNIKGLDPALRKKMKAHAAQLTRAALEQRRNDGTN